MGGLGSGNHWHRSSKCTVNNYRSIDIRKWHREGFLTAGCAFSQKWERRGEYLGSISVEVMQGHVILDYHYKIDGKSEKFRYAIDIVWTKCNLGGKRPWFKCPIHKCGRRSAVLYGGALFACRHCYNLAYPSQRENLDNRATRQAEKIRNRLAWEPGFLNGEGFKPKGMHWKTYYRLCYKHNYLVRISLSEASRKFV